MTNILRYKCYVAWGREGQSEKKSHQTVDLTLYVGYSGRGGAGLGLVRPFQAINSPHPRAKLLDQIRHHAQMMHAGLPHIYFPIDFDTSGDPWLQVDLRIGMLAQVLSLTHAFAKQQEGLPQVATPGYNLM